MAQATSTGLLDLAPEIWTCICKLAAIEPYEIFASNLASHEKFARNLAPPSITRVCRCIRAETLPAFYAQNTFTMNLWPHAGVDGLVRWIKTLMVAGLWRYVSDCRVLTKYKSAGGIGTWTGHELQHVLARQLSGGGEVKLHEQELPSDLPHGHRRIWASHRLTITRSKE